MAYKWPPKDPDEVLDYDHDHGPRLAGDEIVTAIADVVDGDVTVESTDHLAGVQKVWLSGGSEGTENLILLRITTVDGRTMDESVKIKIRTR